MRVKKIFRWLVRLAIAGVILVALGIGVTYMLIAPELPPVEQLREVQLEVPLRIYTRQGDLMAVFGERRRQPVTIEQVPDCIRNAFVAGEDARFYEHPGVDWQGISRAVIHLIRTGDKSVGGSTITQQLARNFFLSFEKTYIRKTKEIFLALRIEKELSKDEILELYLNKIFLGHRAYGVGAAAQVYYGRTLQQLSLAQCAMIAALPKAPSRINPITRPERALERRNYVLKRMLELDYINEADYQAAVKEKDLAFYHGPTVAVNAPFVAEMVRADMIRRFGDSAYSGGYTVRTTIDTFAQLAANQAIRDGLFAYDQRHGYRGAEAQVELSEDGAVEQWDRALQGYRAVAGLLPGLVLETEAELAMVYLPDGQTVVLDPDSVTWAKPFISRNQVGDPVGDISALLSPGDIIRLRRDDEGRWLLAQLPEAESALVSLRPDDGALAALVGGFDFNLSKFNRATQSRRQPGSSFKPFIYSAALERGYNTATMVNDAPVVYRDPLLERTWKPENFSEKFYGPTRLREAMVNSRNLVSIRLLEDIGVDYAIDYISEFGFDRELLPPDLSMALGSATLPPISIATGYAVFANNGYRVEPYYIEQIESAEGIVLYQSNPSYICEHCRQIQPLATKPPEASAPALITVPVDAEETAQSTAENQFVGPPEPNPAERVISAQNAFLVRSMMQDVIKRGTGRQAMELERRDLAGKTGTTNDQRDAWFSGYNSDLVTTVWVGFDDHQPLGRGELGGRAALPIWIDYMRVALSDYPDREMIMPNGLAQVRIDPNSGKLAPVNTPGAIMEVFRLNEIPEPVDFTTVEGPDQEDLENPYELF